MSVLVLEQFLNQIMIVRRGKTYLFTGILVVLLTSCASLPKRLENHGIDIQKVSSSRASLVNASLWFDDDGNILRGKTIGRPSVRAGMLGYIEIEVFDNNRISMYRGCIRSHRQGSRRFKRLHEVFGWHFQELPPPGSLMVVTHREGPIKDCRFGLSR